MKGSLSFHYIVSEVTVVRGLFLFCSGSFALYFYERFACLYVCHVYAWYLRIPWEGFGSGGTRISDYREHPCGFWEIQPGSSGITEPFLHSLLYGFYFSSISSFCFCFFFSKIGFFCVIALVDL